MVQLNEEDIASLLKLNSGEHVTGVMADDARSSILIRIDGGEDLPEYADGTYPMRVERSFAMVDLRRRLLLLLSQESDSAEFADDLRTLLREELLP
jgi:hypothetical protein